MSQYFSNFKRFLWGIGLWLLILAALWTSIGISRNFLFYGIWTGLFVWMAVEDFCDQTVDLRLAAILFSVTAWHQIAAVGIREYGLGCLVGCLVSAAVYIFSLRIVDKSGQEAGRHKILACQMGFVPSIGISLALFSLDREVSYWDIFWGAESLVLFSIFLGFACIFRGYQIYRERRKKGRTQIQAGLGEGDILICTIVGGLIGHEYFLPLLFVAMCVHLFLSMVGFFIGSMLRREKV